MKKFYTLYKRISFLFNKSIKLEKDQLIIKVVLDNKTNFFQSDS